MWVILFAQYFGGNLEKHKYSLIQDFIYVLPFFSISFNNWTPKFETILVLKIVDKSFKPLYTIEYREKHKWWQLYIKLDRDIIKHPLFLSQGAIGLDK